VSQRHWQLPTQKQPRAMEARLHGQYGQPQDLANLPVGEIFEITQHQDRLIQRLQQFDSLPQALLPICRGSQEGREG